MIDHSTICALASWTAPCLRGIVRLSGAEAWEIGQSVWSGPAFSGGAALYGAVRLPPGTAPAWAYCFAGPRSYTGEDQLEIHLPGNPLLIRLLLEALVKAGARPAEPGEFTARAYFNGRLDLTEAEGVAAIVSAQNEQELQAGRQLLGGELARRLAPSMEALTQTLALLEVGIDFSEEDVTFLSPADLEERRSRLVQSLDELLADSRRFERLSHEPTVVLAGRPNAGKSSLLNALSQSERAVVSNTPGTTRDALSAEVALARGMIRLVDVAGLEAPCTPLDRQMHERALRELVEADLAVLLVDAMDQRPPMDLPRQPDLVVHTKADLLASAFPLEAIYISTLTGAGLDRLRERLDELAFGERDPGGTLALNQRHVTAIQQARGVLAALGVDQAEAAPELVADDLRAALDELGGILGQVTPDDVLGRIFSSFCIGK